MHKNIQNNFRKYISKMIFFNVTHISVSGVKRQLSRQKEMLDSSIWSLDVVTRDLTYKIENARSQAMQIAQGVSAIEQWRWLTGLGNYETSGKRLHQ